MTRHADKVGSATAIAVGIFYLINCFSISTYTPNPMDIGSRAYPLAVGVLALLLSVIWALKAWRPAKESISPETRESQAGSKDFSWIRLAALTVLTFLAVSLIEPVGFIAVGVVYLFAAIVLMVWERPTTRQIIIYGLVAAVGAFALKWLLSDVLGIYLP